ncbi:nicotianamine synthase family protein [Vibrio genomosp. F10 str. 9ZC157]|uniref:SAM-dependent methyltransferase n=1 Tax=Vibrio genomosp. F10 str. ZF-129 TaxID=1187848 RepID=A0A1E5BBG7_9VIBR|nr:nicotianamine synthase family protein [Vibrio genomosp. F10]OEE31495.1 hypothetical protein A1QO_13215 [Vibrio genomosp. F10 str. ZF-129]OEE95400.1 hypothetical protein A1QM_04980 [Vibrio genomosp. F10 str. 9ZC157]
MPTEKYQLLSEMAVFEARLAALSRYSLENCHCFVLVQDGLDQLCDFIRDPNHQAIWQRHLLCGEVDRQLKRLRETAIHALCLLERHQSACAKQHTLDVTQYLNRLSVSASTELQEARISLDSKVLFIGSGSYPLSAFTIAQLTGADVLGVDIDEKAVKLASDLGYTSQKVSFTHDTLKDVLQRYTPTHVIIASLVEHKWEVLAQLRPLISDSTCILVRFGNGIKSAFNYPFNPNLSMGWRSTSLDNKQAVYDVIMMEKC